MKCFFLVSLLIVLTSFSNPFSYGGVYYLEKPLETIDSRFRGTVYQVELTLDGKGSFSLLYRTPMIESVKDPHTNAREEFRAFLEEIFEGSYRLDKEKLILICDKKLPLDNLIFKKKKLYWNDLSFSKTFHKK